MSRHGSSMQQVLEDLVNQVPTCVPTVKTGTAAKSSFLQQPAAEDYTGVGKGPKLGGGVKKKTGFAD
ncbi:unnamed protein product, partial [Amoebophrya sp. A120]|eukprot:GSA120T00004726001.1